MEYEPHLHRLEHSANTGVTAVAPHIGSPSTAFWATSSALTIEESMSDSAEPVGALEPSAATGGMRNSE